MIEGISEPLPGMDATSGDRAKDDRDLWPVRVLYGPCIPEGDSRSPGDVTLMNGHLAVTFAAETDPPWGLLRGGLIDAAVVRDGRSEPDCLSVFDFLPDNWAGWPNTAIRVEVLESGPEAASVRVERDWGEADLVSTYTLKSGEDRVHIRTIMTNNGQTPTRAIASGYALWPRKGHILTPPGMKKARQGETKASLADWFVGYDQDWAMALHAPFVDWMDHYGKGMFKRHILAPGEHRGFDAWLQICPSGDISPVLDFEMARKGKPRGRLSGRVMDGKGRPVPRPVILVKNAGAVYCWTLGDQGSYALNLPEGTYSVQATGFQAGATEAVSIDIARGRETTLDFAGLSNPARLGFQVADAATGDSLDARITIVEGRQPEIGFLGQKTFFTDLDRTGWAGISVPPGAYEFEISHGADFLAPPKRVRVEAVPDRQTTVAVDLDRCANPGARGWYSADLHHHGDVLDGATAPSDAVRSQLASGLDILFLSDHDAASNNPPMAELANRRDILFLPAMEISRSWGHFNIYPMMRDPRKKRDPVSGSPTEIFRTARDMGAEIIVANHPYSTYGYFRNLDLGNVPGRYDPGFDLVEINYQHPVEPVIQKVWNLWNQGWKGFLIAGTDSHDVQSDVSGAVRTVVYIHGAPTVGKLIDALKSGRSYASFGPLIFPEIMFGSRIDCRGGTPLHLAFDLMSVNGLSRVDLVENGRVTEFVKFEDHPKKGRATFAPTPVPGSWYALVVTDKTGKKAYTNPIRVSLDRSTNE